MGPSSKLLFSRKILALHFNNASKTTKIITNKFTENIKYDSSIIKSKVSHTVWKFNNFSVTKILREINFRDSKSPKTAVSCHFRSCEFCTFGEFQPSKSEEIHKKSKFRASKCVKTADFALLESLKLISRKI